MRRSVRLISILLLLTLVITGGHAEDALRGYERENGYVYVTLGHYMQSIDGGNPKEKNNTWTWAHDLIKDTSDLTIEKTPLIWRVLTADEEKIYLASEYVLFAMPMHKNYTEYKKIGEDFGQTELSHYLNGEFAETAFTAEEMEMLLPCETFGKVFLLDSEDLKSKAEGMGVGNGLKCWGTEYAIRVTGLYVFQVKYGAHSAYWARNQSTTDKRHARCTKDGGQLGHIISDRENEGVRPALYLDPNAYGIASGSGTLEDPYVLVPKQE